MEAELWDILHELKITQDAGIRNLIIEVDCLGAVELVKDVLTIFMLYSMISQIKECTKQDWNVFISHLLRDANRVVDFCANWAREKNLWLHAILDPSHSTSQNY